MQPGDVLMVTSIRPTRPTCERSSRVVARDSAAHPHSVKRKRAWPHPMQWMRPHSDHLWALVLAGGDGTRLQAITRLITGAPIPKQYCRIIGDRSLLETTLERVAPLV